MSIQVYDPFHEGFPPYGKAPDCGTLKMLCLHYLRYSVKHSITWGEKLLHYPIYKFLATILLTA